VIDSARRDRSRSGLIDSARVIDPDQDEIDPARGKEPPSVASQEPRRLVRGGPLRVSEQMATIVSGVVRVPLEPPLEVVEALQLAFDDRTHR
jgi:hypothetical protein